MTLKIHISEHDDDLHHTTAKRNLAGGVAGLDGSGNILDTSGNIALTDDLKDIVNGVAGLDGSTQILESIIPGILEYYTISDSLLHSHDVLSYHDLTIYTLQKTITISDMYPTPSILRIKFNLTSYFNGFSAFGIIYKNGVPVGTERENNTNLWVTYSEDISFADGDTIELYTKSTAPHYCGCENFRIYGNIEHTLAEAITAGDVGEASGFTGINS